MWHVLDYNGILFRGKENSIEVLLISAISSSLEKNLSRRLVPIKNEMHDLISLCDASLIEMFSNNSSRESFRTQRIFLWHVPVQA